MTAGRRREAWGHRDKGAAGYDPPHLVDWASGTYDGRALCGKEILPARLDPAGTADRVEVKVCPACLRATQPLARDRGRVVDMAERRAQRRLF